VEVAVVTSAPTALQGHVTEQWYAALGDFTEYIGELTHPLASYTYNQMRRDPQLAAILTAYTLPIRRATWAVDPTGCRPEVAQMVADDLGLPVVGDDSPGAARTRGMSWAEHLRTALLHLTFGHYAFELLAEVRGGQARLVGAFERLPQTITNLHVDDQGQLLGISQDMRGLEAAPQIKADRLVWYAHDREGANWYGSSLLRPAYAPWLLKREMQRVLATSSRRFGMGVPTVEWASGTTPTPGQIAAGQQAASAARVGDEAGLSMPPGARLALIGLSGGTPDTLAFIKWLDQQMSRMALAGFLDLGDTSNGSRALGDAFIDLFTLSITAIGEYTSDVATRQIAARIVDWNFGDTESVPRVTCSDVGTKHDITAEAIQQLMQVGAITADPALEAYVRRAYRLPQRDQNVPPPLPKSPAQAQPVAGGRRSRRNREPSDGQLELPLAAAAGDAQPSRDLTADEQTSGADFPAIQAEHDAAVAALVAALPALLAPIAASLVAATATALASGAAGALGSLVPDAAAVGAWGDRIAEEASGLAAIAADRASVELAHIGLPVINVAVDDAALADHAQATARLVGQGMASAASRVALLHNGPGADPATVTGAVQAALDEIVTDERNWVTGSLGAAMSVAQHAGRLAAFHALARGYGVGRCVSSRPAK
jgi:hypothetical protein